MHYRASDQYQGRPVETLLDDIPPVQPHSREHNGFPTQKPLALLKRIINASSNEGDVVLDPCCGSGTTCVAAEQLGRQWIGIDISPRAVELTSSRLQQTVGELFHDDPITERSDIPQRSDILPAIEDREQNHDLFREQGSHWD